MQTTQDQIRQRLNLLPETMLQEVLLFIDFLLSKLKIQITPSPLPPSTDFAQALRLFRHQIETEGSDIEEIDFFADVRDRAPAPVEAKW